MLISLEGLRRTVLSASLGVLTILLAASGAQATDYYVATTGNDCTLAHGRAFCHAPEGAPASPVPARTSKFIRRRDVQDHQFLSSTGAAESSSQGAARRHQPHHIKRKFRRGALQVPDQ
jgi:hypothetical protein